MQPLTADEVTRAIGKRSLFSDELARDPWIAFHGTSSSQEARIVEEGLRPCAQVVNGDDVAAVSSVFDAMNWCGDDPGGLAVLGSFTRSDGDWLEGARPVYLAEDCERAALYATSDFAGGEAARAVRRSFADLRTYLCDGELRDEHLRKQIRVAMAYIRNDCLPPPVIQVDPGWLEGALKSLDGLAERCQEPVVQYTHGVVFAIRVDRVDLPHCDYNPSMGLRVLRTIPRERVVAGVRLLDADVRRYYHANFAQGPRPEVLERTIQRVSFYGAQCSQPEPTRPASGSIDPRTGLRPSVAGANLAEHLVREHGSDRLRRSLGAGA